MCINMEQIFKSLLQKQGYEHIGIIDAEKKIWGYAKDGVYHFCKEDLTDVKRTDVGFDNGVLVLSIIDDKIRIVKNEESVSSSLIIDNSNNIIAEKKGGPYHLLRINSDSLVMVLENSVSEYTFTNYHTPPCLYRDYPSFLQTHFYSQTIILNGKIEKDSFLYKHFDSYYFFYIRKYDEILREIVYRTAKIIFNGIASTNQVIYEGAIPYLWLHKDNTLDIINVDDNKVVEHISHSNTKKYNIPDMMGNSDLQLSYEIDNFNDDCILFPFSEGEGVFVLHRKLSKVVLEYKYYNYDTYCFYYFQEGNTKLFGNIIEVSHTYPISCDSETTDFYLYNIYGEYLTDLNSSSDYGYFVFRKYGNEIEHEEGLYGVIEYFRRVRYRMVVPPIYEKIKDVGEGYFEVYCRNPLNSKDYLIGVYETNNGMVIPLGMNFRYPQYYVYFSNQAKLVGLPFGIVYSYGTQKGLIMGSKVLDAKYDSIDGFSYNGDYYGEYVSTSHYGEVKRNKEYTPKSVILSKGGLRGLFFIEYNKGLSKNVIEPIYENMHCCMLLEGHAYFEVRCGEKYGVISDSLKFNEISKCIYDKVEVEDREGELVIKVYKDGKIGMLSSNLNRSIPVKYSNLVILRDCYIGDGKYYSMRGVELLSEKEFVFIADGECCQAYKNRGTDEYVFICGNGKKLDYNQKYTENIIEVKSSDCDVLCKFDVDTNSFIEEDDDSNGYYDYLREEEERRFYENEGYRDAYDGNPDAQWNTD